MHDMYGRFNPLNAELNAICYLLTLLGTHHFLHVSKIRVNTSVHCSGRKEVKAQSLYKILRCDHDQCSVMK